MRYTQIVDALAVRFPELRPCIERLEADWGAPDPDPPGAYIFFGDIFNLWIDLLCVLPPNVAERDGLLDRSARFVEEMLTSDDVHVRNLATIESIHTIGFHVWNRDVGLEPLGPLTVAAMPDSRNAGPKEPPRTYIDLWGVREVLANLLPDLSIQELPGVTCPAGYRQISTLELAQKDPDGAVLLSMFGSTSPMVIARATTVRCDERTLFDLARRLAPIFAPRESKERDAKPGPIYFPIPRGERVHSLDEDGDCAARFNDDLWFHASLRDLAQEIRSALSNGPT